MHLKQVTQPSREQKKDKDCSDGEDQADETLGQNVKGHGGSNSPTGPARRLLAGLSLLQRGKKEIKAQRQPQSHGHVGNKNARENKRTKSGNKGERRIQPGFLALILLTKHPASQPVRHQ